MTDRKSKTSKAPRQAVTPAGINHLVLNVRNLEESHQFWTEIIGFKQVGELHPTPQRPNPPKMRFYSGDHDGQMNHHDIALVENPDLPAPPEKWSMFGMPVAVNHIAITLPNREAWLQPTASISTTPTVTASNCCTSCRARSGKATSTAP